MDNEKYCLGCGVKLQETNILFEGYTADISNDFCSRCFRMKNYGEYQISTKSNDEFVNILKEINNTKDLVLYVVDLLNIEKDITTIRNYISNRLILVLTKRDVLPLSINNDKIKEYFSKLGLDYQDLIIISSKNNFNVDELLLKIKMLKSSKNVYVVGHTNVGKSTLIKKLMQNYSESNCDLTISPMPSTTLNKISIQLNDDITLIDTPGLVDRGNITNYIEDLSFIKKISSKKEIKTRTYQVKTGQTILVNDILRVDYVDGPKNSFTFFMSNELEIDKKNVKKDEYPKDLTKVHLEVGYHQDIVINGLGFIKIVEKGSIDLFINKNVEVFTRDSLV